MLLTFVILQTINFVFGTYNSWCEMPDNPATYGMSCDSDCGIHIKLLYIVQLLE